MAMKPAFPPEIPCAGLLAAGSNTRELLAWQQQPLPKASAPIEACMSGLLRGACMHTRTHARTHPPLPMQKHVRTFSAEHGQLHVLLVRVPVAAAAHRAAAVVAPLLILLQRHSSGRQPLCQRACERGAARSHVSTQPSTPDRALTPG